MKIYPVTDAQRSFLQVEIVDRYTDDEDVWTAECARVVAEHLHRKHGGGFALLDPAHLADLLNDVSNGIDAAIEHGVTVDQGYGDRRAARGLMRTCETLRQKVLRAVD